MPNTPNTAKKRIDFDNVPTGVSLSEDNVQRLSDRATETATAFHRKLDKLQATFAEARDRYSRDAEAMIADASPEDRSAARAFAKKNAAHKIAELRRSLISNSEGERAELLRALKTYSDEAEAVAAVCVTPAMMLGRVALGEPKRTQYQQQLEGAGPVELETAARQAVMSGDVVLAAAVATVIDRRTRDRRPFPVADLAERVMGEVHDRVNAKLEGVRLAYKTAVAADREFVRGKADPLMNLSLALSRQAAAEAEGEE